MNQIVFQSKGLDPSERRIVTRLRLRDGGNSPTAVSRELLSGLSEIEGLRVYPLTSAWGVDVKCESLTLWPWSALEPPIVAVYCAVAGWDPAEVTVLHELHSPDDTPQPGRPSGRDVRPADDE